MSLSDEKVLQEEKKGEKMNIVVKSIKRKLDSESKKVYTIYLIRIEIRIYWKNYK